MNENYSFQKSTPQNKTKNNKSLKDSIHLLFLLFSLLGIATGFSQTTINITTTGAGTFNVPCDVTSITVQVWGGGGGGYGDNNNNNIVGHGGGGGAYTTGTLAVTGGQVINFTVGAGGNGGSSIGGNGGDTTFLTLTAGGGTGGSVSSGGVGGTASGGTTNLSGGNGTAGINPIGGSGGSGAGPGGGTGGTGGGDGVNGTSGSTIGGGGGASGDRSGGARTGGAGARGQITITYTSTLQTYCSPTFTTAIEPITNVTFAGINNTTSNTVNGSSALESFCYAATVMQGSPTNIISVKGNTDGNFTDYIRVYIDWDQNGTFGNNANEIYDLGTITNSTGVDAITLTSNIAVPATASIGVTKMRVMKRYNGYPTGSCQTGTGYGQAEDYIVNVVAPLPCVTPTSQPTALSLTPTGATIAGSFTAASPAADNYLVLISVNSSAPSAPVNGTTYTIGSTYQTGYMVVDNDTNTTFTATGLTPLTTYYVYIYSFNSVCTGGPAYLGTNPLTGSTTTLTPDYCIPTISSTYQTSTTCHIQKVEFIGTLQDITNTSSFPTVVPFGYENYTGLALKSIQAKGEGVNIYMESPNSGYIKAWVDWNQDGDFLDAGETVYDAGGVSQASTTFGFIVPTGIPAADYRVRLRISGRNSSMFGTDAGYSWDACSTDLNYYGETEDYLLRVIDNCNAKISSITSGSVCGSGVVTLQATGTAGTTEFRWYSSETGGSLLGTTTSGSWDTPSISTTTDFWVTAYNGSCETLVRTKITAFVKTVPTLTFATSATEICGENSIVALTAAGDTELIYLIDENFESGLGTFTNVHYVSNAAVNSQTAWQTHTGPYIPTGLTWYPAISSGFGANSFAFVTSDIGGYYTGPNYNYYTINNGLVSSTVNSTSFLNLTLTLRLYFDRYYPDGANATSELMTIDVSTNGGTSWTSISGNITGDVGYGTKFSDITYDLSAYINQPNLKIRVRYYSDTWANGAAVDDIQLFGTKALNTAFVWSGSSLPDAYLDAATTIPYTSGASATTVYVKPTLTQLEMGSYTFTATATLSNGCDVSQDITITNKTSVWRGTSSNDWNDPNNWSSAAVPDINTCVIIPDITSTNPSNVLGAGFNAYGKTLNIKDNGVLEITSGNTLTIQNLVDVNTTGVFRIQNSGSLIQIDNIANTGNISMKRDVNIRKL
ncbi:GEVED domain-containing protein, partial [Flavobacterium sp. U410]